MEDFPYPHFFDTPEQVFVPRTGIRGNDITVFVFYPYIPRSVADREYNCHFSDYNPVLYYLGDLYNLSRLYTHLFSNDQYNVPLAFYRRNENESEIKAYINWLLQTRNPYSIRYHHHSDSTIDNMIRSYDAIHIMQNNVNLLNKELKHYHVPKDKIATGSLVQSSGPSYGGYVKDPLMETVVSARYYYELNGKHYQILSDDYFNTTYLKPNLGYGMERRVYVSNIGGEWYYDTKRDNLVNNLPAHPIDDFPDGTVFVTAFDKRRLLTVMDARDYVSHPESYRQLRQGWSALNYVLKNKSHLDNTIGKYVTYRDHWHEHTIYLKKVDGRLRFEYYDCKDNV